MRNRWRVIASILGGVGLGTAGYLLLLMGLKALPLPHQHPFLQALGIRKPTIIGFYPYWLLNKTTPESLQHVTNFTYFGLTINGDGSIQKLTKPTEEEPGWTWLKGNTLTQYLTSATTSQKEKSLLVHISNQAAIESLISQPEQHAKKMVAEIEPLMTEYRFTDLNLDIESFQEASPSAQQAFTTLVKTIKQELVARQLGTLTVEITPISFFSPQLIDPIAMGEIADRVVVMAYDYHYRGSLVTGPVAPLGGAPEHREFDVRTTIQAAIQKIPSRKIILGIPVYGYEWETISRHPGSGVIPGSGKTASHQRVQEVLATCVHCEKRLDPIAQQPYVILPTTETGYTQQMYYEDSESLQLKQAFAQQAQLGGVAFWAMGYEGEGFFKPLSEYRASYWLIPEPISTP